MSEDVISRITIGAMALVMGLIIFAAADKGMGTHTTYPEKVTVVDTYKRHVKSGKTTITKYYITVETETGAEDIKVSHDFYSKVEINDEIDITKTITETKFTHNTITEYEID